MLTPLFNKAYRAAISSRLSGNGTGQRMPPGGRTEKILLEALFTVMGRLAKLDGLVTQSEIDFATALMSRLGLSHAQRQAAIGWFDNGKQADCDVIPLVRLLAKNIGAGSELASLFLQTQCKATLAKGEMRLREKMLLRDIAEELGFSKAQLHATAEAMRLDSHPQPGSRSFVQQAFHELRLDPRANADEIRRAYLRLMSQYHPDKLMTKNLSAEALQYAQEQAQKKSTAIRQAYETLRSYRRIRA